MKATFARIMENRWFSRMLSPMFLLLLALLFSLLTGGRFSNPRNLRMVLEQALVVATVATGAVFIFATGNVNISMGAATALIATLAAQAYLASNSLAVMFLVALAAGAFTLAVTALLLSLIHI